MNDLPDLIQMAENAGSEGSLVLEKVKDQDAGFQLERRDRLVQGPARYRRHLPGDADDAGHPQHFLHYRVGPHALVLITEVPEGSQKGTCQASAARGRANGMVHTYEARNFELVVRHRLVEDRPWSFLAFVGSFLFFSIFYNSSSPYGHYVYIILLLSHVNAYVSI